MKLQVLHLKAWVAVTWVTFYRQIINHSVVRTSLKTTLDVICSPTYEPDVLSRGKRSIALDLKRPEGVAVVRAMCKNADVLIEPFRAGALFCLLFVIY